MFSSSFRFFGKRNHCRPAVYVICKVRSCPPHHGLVFVFANMGHNPDALRRFVLIFKDSSGDFYIYFARSCPLFSGGSLLYYGDNIPAIIFFDLLCLWSSVCFGDTTRPFRCLLIGFRFDFFVCLSFSLM